MTIRPSSSRGLACLRLKPSQACRSYSLISKASRGREELPQGLEISSRANRSDGISSPREEQNTDADAGSGRPKKQKQRVVILGSGWAGYGLARTLDPDKFERIVVSPRSHFVFTPLLASTAVGTLEFRAVVEPVRRLGVTFHQGWADDVDFDRRVVRVEANVGDDAAARTARRFLAPSSAAATTATAQQQPPAEQQRGPMVEVPYDKLVVAVGAYTQTFGIEGVSEHAHFLRDVGDARRIRLRVLSLFERCAALPPDAETRDLLHFTIVGGGPTGIEFAAELHDLVHEDLTHIYPTLTPLVRITVYDVAPAVLPMFDRELAGYATELFARRGIDVRTRHHLTGIRAAGPGEAGAALGGLRLRIEEHGDGEVGTGMVVWSTGLMQNPVVGKLLAKELRVLPDSSSSSSSSGSSSSNSSTTARLRSDAKSGGIVTDAHQRAQVEGADGTGRVLDDVFVIGDCAVSEADPTLPRTAQVASQQAVHLAKALNRGTVGERAFAFRNWGTMAYLGGWRAIHQSSADELKGWAAWVLWRTAYLTYSMSVRNKIVVPFYWFVSWVFGRDITRF
ncbi:hypothetical protein, variant [Gaeumannomyces tritici R3-111a-1]|uniref:Uncharacterized protein n=1 Tax=Gaeumannomyces tritici (strain R3-111a-1) TaxID=644352 RepID=J3NRM8_GAET3|nr:hypothetical protein, variant [Gaeumannomyces tritici R3-111a-1]EJT78833.1 hypothetical protein, variant [Gaeumannomyces tritici R3-111a-1]